jgi:hypothetical protein
MQPGRRRSPVATALAFLAVYVALTLVYTWPLAVEGERLIASDPGDPILNASILWWNAVTVPFSGPWWNAPHYYPSEGIAAFTENLAAISVIASPVQWITGNPIAAYNLALFLSWPLSAFAVYLLVWFIARRPGAAFIAGLVYAFTPYRITELPHLQMLSSYWLPLSLLALHGYLEDRRTRWLWLFGVSWVLQSLANLYFMLFGGVLVALWLAYFGSRPPDRRVSATLVGTWIAASLPLVPVIYKYRVIHDYFGLRRGEHEALFFAATPQGWFEVSHLLWIWGSVLPRGKDNLFPGLTAAALVIGSVALALLRPGWRLRPGRTGRVQVALIAICVLCLTAIGLTIVTGGWSATIGPIFVRMRHLDRALALLLLCGVPLLTMSERVSDSLRGRSAFVFYTGATLIIALLCCGPKLRVGNAVLLESAPYSWLMWLPGFDGVRVPARFWMLGILTLSVAAGLAYARLPLTSWRAARTTAVLALSVGVMVDGWLTAFPLAAPYEAWPTVEPRDRTEPILELPIGPDWDWGATYRAHNHGRRVVNGVSGYDPPHYVALVAGLRARDPAMLPALASFGAIDVVVSKAGDPDGQIARYVAAAHGAVAVADDGQRTTYRIPKGPPEVELGAALPLAEVQAFRHDPKVMHDASLDTGWGDLPQTRGQWIMADLGSVKMVSGVSNAIGRYFLDFPRRLRIEISTNGMAWETVWEGLGATPAFLASVRDPREAALRFGFDPRPARLVRLVQLDEFQSMWRVSELRVHGSGS